jgi:hypothetical protein
LKKEITLKAKHLGTNATVDALHLGGRDQDKLPIERGYVLNAENTLRRHVINRLMCQFHLDIAALNTQFGIDFFTHFAPEIAALKTLQGDGLLTLSPATLFFALLVLSSCSNRGVYEGIQASNRNECSKLPPSQYDECMEKANKSFTEYERERKEAIGQ